MTKEKEDEKKEIEKIEEKEDSKKSSEDESGLEEDLKDTETNIDENKFQDILINTNSNSPSLEQVAISHKPLTSLEMGLSQAHISKEEKENLNYEVSSYDKNKKDKSYSEMQGQNKDIYSANVQTKDFQNRTTHDHFQKSKEAYKV